MYVINLSTSIQLQYAVYIQSSFVLQGNTNPISSSVMFISSSAGRGGGEPFDQSRTSGTPEGSNFPGVLCHSCSVKQEGHLQMWGGHWTGETSWVRVQFYAVVFPLGGTVASVSPNCFYFIFRINITLAIASHLIFYGYKRLRNLLNRKPCVNKVRKWHSWRFDFPRK